MICELDHLDRIPMRSNSQTSINQHRHGFLKQNSLFLKQKPCFSKFMSQNFRLRRAPYRESPQAASSLWQPAARGLNRAKNLLYLILLLSIFLCFDFVFLLCFCFTRLTYFFSPPAAPLPRVAYCDPLCGD